LLPEDDLALVAGDERHATILRDDDGEASRVALDEAIGRAMASADVFYGVELSL
jgi:hypothetical protein